MPIYSIYRATNNHNGMCYIGFTKNFDKRVKEHMKFSRCKSAESYHYYFMKALRKYGNDSFTWDIIYQSTDLHHTINIEEHFIREYNSFGYGGYNMTYGGQGGMTGKIHTEETKKKMKTAWSKRENRSGYWGGKKHNQETLNKISESRLKRTDNVQIAQYAGRISAGKRRNNPEYSKEMSERMKLWWIERKQKLAGG